VLVVPHSGDMAENAARADWAGVGVRLPWRLLDPRTLRLAVRRALSDPSLAERAGSLADWAARHEGATRAAELVEGLAAGSGIGAGGVEASARGAAGRPGSERGPAETVSPRDGRARTR
jgi:UDP:flavonoid glycosyltransferase YjiC (YdhE family)